MAHQSSQDIRDRTFHFGCEVAKLALSLPQQPGIRRLVDQLLAAGTSVGANLEEAKAGSSKKDFIRYVEIALRESREAAYWLRMCEELKLGNANRVSVLRDEAEQLSRILSAIVVNAKRNAVG